MKRYLNAIGALAVVAANANLAVAAASGNVITDPIRAPGSRSPISHTCAL